MLFAVILVIFVRLYIRRKLIDPKKNKTNGRKIILKTINIYPVKSCKGISVSKAKIGTFGLENDRRWMIYNPESNRFITQRQFPKLALVTTSFDNNYDNLLLDFPQMPTLKISLKLKNKTMVEKIDIGIWKDSVRGIDEGDEVGEWLNKAINATHPLRLVRMPENHDRQVPTEWRQSDLKDQLVSYADGFPFLLASEESLADLNSRLPETQEVLPMLRFRPNFVIEGQGVAFEEDTWKRIRIGNTIFRPVKKCTRCKVTTVDPAKGEFAGEEPLKTLSKFRKGLLKGKDEVCFAQNLIHETVGGYLEVGQLVDIYE